MRQIGTLPSEEQARAFGDYLIGRGIRNEIERDDGKSWAIWVLDEDHLTDAERDLSRFVSNPGAVEFRESAALAAQVRESAERDLREYQRRIRTAQSLFPRVGGYGVGVLTYALIILCVAVALFSRLGTNVDFLRHWFIVDPEVYEGGFLPEVQAGQVWRLLTPIFIHFGPVHLLFNMMWLYQLGSMIEGRQSTWVLAALVLISGILSNFAQYYFAHSILFGGMSGVVYALAGYVWIRGKFDRASGLYLDPTSVTILLVWLVICYMGIIGSVANTAHLAGLIVGMAWGAVSALLGRRRHG